MPERHRRAVGAGRPDAVYLVPAALVAVEQEVGILRVELHVVQPRVLVADGVGRPGLQVGEDERHRPGIERTTREPVFLADGVALLG